MLSSPCASAPRLSPSPLERPGGGSPALFRPPPTPRRGKHRNNGEPSWLGFGSALGGLVRGGDGEWDAWVDRTAEEAARRVAAAQAAGPRNVRSAGWSPRRVHRLWGGGPNSARAKGIAVAPEPTTAAPFGTMHDGYTFEVSSHAAHNKAALLVPSPKEPAPPATPPAASSDARRPAGRASAWRTARRKYPGGVRGCVRRRRDVRARLAAYPQKWVRAQLLPYARHRKNESRIELHGDEANTKLPERAWEGKRPTPPVDPSTRMPARVVGRRVFAELRQVTTGGSNQVLCKVLAEPAYTSSAAAQSAAVLKEDTPRDRPRCGRLKHSGPNTRSGGLRSLVFPPRPPSPKRAEPEPFEVPQPPPRRFQAQRHPGSPVSLSHPASPVRPAVSRRRRLERLRQELKRRGELREVNGALTGAAVRERLRAVSDNAAALIVSCS
eukprot:TRINITY_DN27324_c0_g1_i1.p1 TRINITY_DN27324_c0_g1~~TRINITY_DN27324_c0_g1_i1.p1  ORF type:complete len:439 (+),score=132.50 TRINITY_DN27324_c0_g1_i1:50-1366(+)